MHFKLLISIVIKPKSDHFWKTYTLPSNFFGEQFLENISQTVTYLSKKTYKIKMSELKFYVDVVLSFFDIYPFFYQVNPKSHPVSKIWDIALTSFSKKDLNRELLEHSPKIFLQSGPLLFSDKRFRLDRHINRRAHTKLEITFLGRISVNRTSQCASLKFDFLMVFQILPFVLRTWK